jgi:hypothetical protein
MIEVAQGSFLFPKIVLTESNGCLLLEVAVLFSVSPTLPGSVGKGAFFLEESLNRC